MVSKHQKKELKCLNTLETKLVITELFFTGNTFSWNILMFFFLTKYQIHAVSCGFAFKKSFRRLCGTKQIYLKNERITS